MIQVFWKYKLLNLLIDLRKKKKTILGKEVKIECPRCKSKETEMVSQFSSTACKAMYKCISCWEPFEYFKCL